MNWLTLATEALALIRQLVTREAKPAAPEVTASPRDIAIAQSSGEAASRAGKEAPRRTKER